MQWADMQLRNAPTGHKGHNTVDRIIDAAADLLEARGYEALTTNHIAQAAGVNIATLYKYFANKEAILIALHLRLSLRWTEALTRLVSQLREGAPWRETVCQIIDVAAGRRRGATVTAAMRIAMRVSPELQAYDRAESIESARVVADMLIDRANVDPVTAMRVGRVVIEVGMAVLDLWLHEESAEDAELVVEAKAVVCSYLAPYFEGRAPPEKTGSTK
jgi:AcrR family transcriptional regulator